MMNTGDKDLSIINLMSELKLAERGWKVQDYWEGDLCALGIAAEGRPNRWVYVCTYNKPAGRYYYECEEAVGAESAKTLDEGDGVDISKLISVMESHLDVRAF